MALSRREAVRLACLDHPVLPRVLRLTKDDFELEPIAGPTLEEVQLDEASRLDLIGQVAEALVAAHRRRLAHGSIAPRHLVRCERGWVLTGFTGGFDAARDVAALAHLLPDTEHLAPLRERDYRSPAVFKRDLDRVRSGAPPGQSALGPEFFCDEPLVGRRRDLVRLESVLEDGRGQLLLEGPAGLGKSRLLREVGRLAWERGVTVLSGRCQPEDRRGFGVLRSVFGDLGLELEEEEQAVEAWTQSMLAAARKRPLLVLLDDLQYADRSSLRVLERSHQALVILGAADRPLEGWSRLPVTPLSEEHLARLIGHRLGDRRGPVEYLASCCEGSPLAALELVDSLLEQGHLALGDDGWTLEAGAELTGEVSRLLLDRLRHLDPETRELLSVAAVAGEPVSEDLLGRAPTIGVETGFLEPVPGGYRLTHPRLREALLASLDPEHVRALHRRLAERLEEGDPDLLALARHYAAGPAPGLEGRAREVLLEAARHALSEHAADLAGEFLETARELGEDSPQLWEALGEIHLLKGEMEPAIGHLRRALEGLDDPIARGRVRSRLGAAFLRETDTEATWEQFVAGVDELGFPFRPGPLQVVRYLVRPRRGESAVHRTLLKLGAIGQLAAFLEGNAKVFPVLTARALWSAQSLGAGPDLAELYGQVAVALARWRLRAFSEGLSARAERLARESGNPAALARSAFLRSVASMFLDPPLVSEAAASEVLDTQGARLLNNEYMIACAYLVHNLRLRGYAHRALARLEEAHRRSPTDHHLYLSYAPLLTTLGADGSRYLELFRGRAEERPILRALVAYNEVAMLVEQGESGERFDETVERFRSLGFGPRHPYFMLGDFYVYQAYGRYLQCLHDRERLPALRAALDELRAAATVDTREAHRLVLECAYAWLQGRRPDFARAEALAHRSDNPWALYELLALRSQAGSLPAATAAATLAREHGWALKAARWEPGRTPDLDFGSGHRLVHSLQERLGAFRVELFLDGEEYVAGATAEGPVQRVRLDEHAELVVTGPVSPGAVRELELGAGLAGLRAQLATQGERRRRRLAEALGALAQSLGETLDEAVVRRRLVGGCLEVTRSRWAAGVWPDETLMAWPDGVVVAAEDWEDRLRSLGEVAVAALGEDSTLLVGLGSVEPEVQRERLNLVAFHGRAALENARLFRELESAYRRLQESEAQLVQSSKMAAVGQLAAGVAHELNTPLGTVLLSLDSAASNPELAEFMIDMARQGAHQAKEIVSKLLYYSRDARAGRQATDLNRVVEDTLALLGNQLRLDGIRVETQLGELPVLNLNQNEMQQVVSNLLLNARDAVQAVEPDRRRITVRTGSDEGGAWLEVVDRGRGVPDEIVQRLFEPFFTTKPVGRGTGLGLSVSREIITGHGGTIEFSLADPGSRFTVALPRPAPSS